MRKNIILQLLLIVMLISSCASKVEEPFTSAISVEESDGWDITKSPLNGLPIHDNPYLYDDSLDTEIEYIYVTILPTIDNSGEKIVFTDLSKMTDFRMDAPELDIYFQQGDEGGPYADMVIDAVQSNATITLRGHSTRQAVQKSYKIKLSDKVSPWFGQTTLNLNKHAFDSTRILNKVAFDLFEDLPDVTSMQLKFTKLYVRDNSNSSNNKFVDYGYFTHIEQPNKKFLNAHELDSSGNLYKAEFFEFLYDPKRMKDDDDPGYNEALFEEAFERKVGDSNKKLIRMIQDVNDYSLSINEVMETHFNEDNFLTWLAVNILLGNYDTQSQNYLLYNPTNALTWYFLPWDYDGALGNDFIASKLEVNRYDGKRHYGIPLYWNSVLAQRYFKYPENVDALSEKIELVSQHLSPVHMEHTIDKYKNYSYNAITSMPDIMYLRDSIDYVEEALVKMVLMPQKNKETYYEALEAPMPVYMGDVIKEGDEISFVWDKSYDLQGDYIYYKVEISSEPYFNEPFYSKDNIITTNITLNLNQYDITGNKFWRVTIYDEHGHIQYPFDSYEDADNVLHQGVRDFTIY